MGRPTKSDAEKLSKTIAWRVTEGVYQELMEKYKASGLTQSEFLRELLDERKDAVTIIARPQMTVDKKRLLFLASKSSNNINQLAHKVNSHHVSGLISDSVYESILKQLSLSNEILKGFIQNVD
ncbi:TPA: plasmid mobilization relaxosome protein MobC [Klebsiella aerogenes]